MSGSADLWRSGNISHWEDAMLEYQNHEAVDKTCDTPISTRAAPGMSYRTIARAIAVMCVVPVCSHAADYTFRINPSKDTATISPYVYGSNGSNEARGANMTCARQGGNRLTGYNWENNASNAGIDYNNQSDGYLGGGTTPGKTITDFIDGCRASNQKSLVTVQMAGYVAADKNGPVDSTEVAPSARWKEVVFAKGSSLSLTPDATDSKVYIDEMVNLLVNKYQKASQGGVFAYSLDNEPCLWKDTHPLLHPVGVTCAELIQKSVACSKAIKAVDNSSLVFGPALFGYSAYDDLNASTDWASVKGSYTWFIDYYLDQIKKASTTAGQRLLDVIDLHWYPEAQGDGKRIIGSNAEVSDPVTAGAVAARMQAPRSLYDTTYTETSWISKWMTPREPVLDWGNPTPGPIGLLKRLKKSIDTYYPGTKIAFTEFTYGAGNHISGGIATADFLGAVGKAGVFMTNKWYVTDKFSAAAYRIYRNYNGANATFGTLSCQASTSNLDSTCVYASLGANRSTLQIIGINKASAAKTVSMEITALANFTSAEVWGFGGADTTITKRTAIASIIGNAFTYTLPSLSVLHFVLSSGSTDRSIAIIPTAGLCPIIIRDGSVALTLSHNGTVALLDAAGKMTLQKVLSAGSHVLQTKEFTQGVYFLRVQDSGHTTISRLVIGG